MYSPGQSFAIYDIRRALFSAHSSPTTTHLIFFMLSEKDFWSSNEFLFAGERGCLFLSFSLSFVSVNDSFSVILFKLTVIVPFSSSIFCL